MTVGYVKHRSFQREHHRRSSLAILSDSKSIAQSISDATFSPPIFVKMTASGTHNWNTNRRNEPLDWSSGRRNDLLSTRFGAYVANEHRSDMMFHVTQDDTLIPAHRFVISSASSVLEAMVYGTGNIPGTPENGTAPVRVPEFCSADEFKQVI